MARTKRTEKPRKRSRGKTIPIPVIAGKTPRTQPSVSQNQSQRKPHRYRPGTRALMEIRKFQKSVDLLIRKLNFQRLVREIARDYQPEFRWCKDAIKALQVSRNNVGFGPPIVFQSM